MGTMGEADSVQGLSFHFLVSNLNEIVDYWSPDWQQYSHNTKYICININSYDSRLKIPNNATRYHDANVG